MGTSGFRIGKRAVRFYTRRDLRRIRRDDSLEKYLEVVIEEGGYLERGSILLLLLKYKELESKEQVVRNIDLKGRDNRFIGNKTRLGVVRTCIVLRFMGFRLLRQRLLLRRDCKKSHAHGHCHEYKRPDDVHFVFHIFCADTKILKFVRPAMEIRKSPVTFHIYQRLPPVDTVCFQARIHSHKQ